MITAFAAIGIDAGVVEHGYKDAKIGGRWRGTEIVVHAYPTRRAEIHQRRTDVVGQTAIRGIPVLRATSTSFGRVLIVTCGERTYEVGGVDPSTLLPAYGDTVE
ncbi:MAG TPA: hypothetical protein VG709_08525, partial [Actinomycetota bacterium]|nr:hypothetical protein [Actinomycetota bacterium]